MNSLALSIAVRGAGQSGHSASTATRSSSLSTDLDRLTIFLGEVVAVFCRLRGVPSMNQLSPMPFLPSSLLTCHLGSFRICRCLLIFQLHAGRLPLAHVRDNVSFVRHYLQCRNPRSLQTNDPRRQDTSHALLCQRIVSHCLRTPDIFHAQSSDASR